MNKHVITGPEGNRLHELENMVFALSDALADLDDVKLTGNRAKYYQRELRTYAENAKATAEKMLNLEEENVRRKLGIKAL